MTRARLVLAVAVIGAVLLSGVAYVGWRASARTAGDDRALQLTAPGSLYYVDPAGAVVRQVSRTDTSSRQGSGPVCQRAYVAGGTLACLRSTSVPFSSEMHIYTGSSTDRSSKPVKTVAVWGNPNRTRVSASGRLVAWTVFRSGDSYASPGQFSTTTGIYDLRSGQHVGSLEDFQPIVDGRPHPAKDVNFWGVTFAQDDRTFYATMGSQSKTWLVRGDLQTKTLTAIHEHVECPSLSPDQTRIAYKYRVGTQWRLHVLTLATGRDVELAEPGDVDDQPAWLDNTTIGYARSDGERAAVFGVPADGSGRPVRLVTGTSPAGS